MKICKNKVVGIISLLSCLTVGSVQADVVVMGNSSDISESIGANYQQPLSTFNGQLNSSDLLYVDAGSSSDSQLEIAKQYIADGATVVVNLTSIPSQDDKMALNQKLTGLGIAAPVVVTGKLQEDIIINAIVSEVTDTNGNPINNPAEETKSINASLTHALNRLNFGGQL